MWDSELIYGELYLLTNYFSYTNWIRTYIKNLFSFLWSVMAGRNHDEKSIEFNDSLNGFQNVSSLFWTLYSILIMFSLKSEN